ncbi:LysE family translocator [Falsihalocynthiibacter sp. SS001]|uniref:LysE family translocator n=1 Tax=Falsihalocynthiibacter sp. SS001 TaxID=3349698 RepID=UPI0036D43400
MLVFTSAIFLLLITPGPGVLSIAGVGAAFGQRAGIRYFLGLLTGTNLVAISVVTGLSGAVLAFPWVFNALFAASICYLTYLAYRIATAGNRIAVVEAKSRPGYWSGILFQALNPKAYVVNTTLFTGFAFMPEAREWEILTKFVIINAIWIPIHILWLWAGSSVRRLDLSEKAHRRINYLMAAAMLSVVALAANSFL